MTLISFYIFASLAVIAALSVIAFRNTLSSAIALVVTLFAVACLYASLQAHFLAVMQVLVYAGAIMVLFIFVIMLMNLGREALLKIKMSFMGVLGILFGGYLATLLVFRLGYLSSAFPENLPEGYGSLQSVGRLMFGEFLIPFEMISILLLVGIVGAVTMTRVEK